MEIGLKMAVPDGSLMKKVPDVLREGGRLRQTDEIFCFPTAPSSIMTVQENGILLRSA